eukprot:NODE_16737_length_980_cov_2.919109.p1 GENE.NODE_16737_length_980_cov_2.919109~~NODE_16737_length_980_cov_2.919109.p1  ORF type:complete len:234 (+),score=73.50 NODE_16737_length_980_cov_2.919109:47-703(+)
MVAMDWFSVVWSLLPGFPVGSSNRPAFLLIDYPGYGTNEGYPPSPSSVLAAQRAVLKAAVPLLAAPPLQLNLLGHSLGAAAAAQFAAAAPPGGGGNDNLPPLGRLVLSAPFMNISAMARALLGRFMPVSLLRLFLSQAWQNNVWVPKAAQIGWNVRIVHGANDSIVPSWMGRQLYNLAKGYDAQCSFTEVPKMDHNNLFNATSVYLSLMSFQPPRSRC